MSWWAIAGILGSAVFFYIGVIMLNDGDKFLAIISVPIMLLATVLFIFSLHWGF